MDQLSESSVSTKGSDVYLSPFDLRHKPGAFFFYVCAMKDTWRHYLGERAPRYTSYPSALHFDASVSERDFTEKLDSIELYEPLSLYVHVPFCRQLCWYCGCNMRVENQYQRARDYVDALQWEIAGLGAHLSGRGRPTGVHFGGGTPNYLTVEDLNAILSSIEREIGLTDSANLAIEMDPRIWPEGVAGELADIGFNRFSFGIQDFDPIVQKAINRVQSFELVEGCVSDIRAAGGRDLSFDVLYGLPHQSLISFSDTLDKVIALSPDRVSVFGYAHLPSALPGQRMIDSAALPDDSLRGELAALADERLINAGYLRIGFDHYAKPDNPIARAFIEKRLKRNFQGFTDDGSSTLLGVGASAISFVDGLYTQNEKDIGAYKTRAREGGSPVARGVQRTKRESVIATAINELLCMMETNVSDVLRCSPPQDAIRICSALDSLEADGVIEWRGDSIAVADGAHALARVVAMAIDPAAQPQRALATAV